MRLPVTIEVILYRKVKHSDGYEFLLLKRVASRGGFWQFLTGGLEDTDKSNLDCAFRELKEELGLSKYDIRKIVDGMPHFEFISEINCKKTLVKEFVFGFEVSSKVKVKLSDEHESFDFLSKDECLKRLFFENNKKALLNLVKIII